MSAVLTTTFGVVDVLHDIAEVLEEAVRSSITAVSKGTARTIETVLVSIMELLGVEDAKKKIRRLIRAIRAGLVASLTAVVTWAAAITLAPYLAAANGAAAMVADLSATAYEDLATEVRRRLREEGLDEDLVSEEDIMRGIKATWPML